MEYNNAKLLKTHSKILRVILISSASLALLQAVHELFEGKIKMDLTQGEKGV